MLAHVSRPFCNERVRSTAVCTRRNPLRLIVWSQFTRDRLRSQSPKGVFAEGYSLSRKTIRVGENLFRELQEINFFGPRHGFDAVVHAQFAVDVLEMLLDRLEGDHQRIRDRLIG